jgi:hypothetical protein|tara:strand:- start:24 stop:455 length:432 start_codon:yes stop_codon:yes gene_type:complete
MTLDELAISLPNGLHDAELHRCTIDYAARSVQLVLKLWVGRAEQMEVYRPAIINIIGMHFWIVESPDPDYPGDDAWLIIDTGEVSALERTPAIHLPDVPQTSFVNWIYVRQWNAFIYVAAETADHRWTGPEEDHAQTIDRTSD